MVRYTLRPHCIQRRPENLRSRRMLRHTPLIALVLFLTCPLAAAPVANAALSAVVISPGSVSLVAGAKHQFSATINGAALNAKWSATGGTISGNGLFTAGQTAGKYLVTADSRGNRGVKGTAVVTIASGRVLTGVTVTPTSAILVGGTTELFKAVGVWSDGTTGPLAVAWTSTGGTITSAGLYTAGQTPGEYRVTAISGNLSATSTVTVTPAAMLTDIVIVAASDPSMQPGQSMQFSASGIWSDGSTHPVAVTWSASGGTITNAGLYTAAQTPGSFEVAATNGTITGVLSISIRQSDVVSIFPGQPIQAIVDGSPERSVFLIKSGVHRRQSIKPRDGMTFVGEPGSILDGENVTPHAFESLPASPREVTIRGLVIERYVPILNLGAIQADNGADWIVEGNEIRYNANVGLKVGARMRVRYNYVHHNGVSGINGYRADGVLIEDNEVAYNNPSNMFVDPTLASESGIKFFEINDLIVRHNNVHHNNGVGIWCDNAYLNMLIEDNAVSLNTTGGIWQEVGIPR